MGFTISGDHRDGNHNIVKVSALKQHVNFSHFAKMVIEDDIKTFGNGEKRNWSGFLNRIFANYYESADATISLRLINKEEELQAAFSSTEFKSIDRKIVETYIDKLLSVYEKDLEIKAYSYEKGPGEKFNIDKANLNILRESLDNKSYPNDNIGAYLKAIFEEYVQKPIYEREQIYFKNTIDTIQSAIAQKKKIYITLLEKLNPKTNETYVRECYFAPYKIVQDKARMFNYVIGYTEEIKKDGSTWPRRIVSYRISKISDAKIRLSMSGFLSQGDKDAIEKEVIKKGVQFLAGNIIELKVRFTDKGLESFNRQLYMRPTEYSSVENEENTFIFKCTEVQAINYFFKFARDVEILSPETTREKFIQRYKDAYDKYTVQ